MQSTDKPQAPVGIPQPDVVVIGAGPVGLWTAIQIALRTPAQVLIREKHPEYARKHVLSVKQSSLVGLPRSSHSRFTAEFKALADSLVGTIRTNVIENKLLSFAKKIGIKIQYTEVKDCYALPRQYPTAKYFIGADGSHSIVRKQVFGNQMRREYNLQHVCFIKYHVAGQAKRLSTLTKMSQYCWHGCIINEHVGRYQNGKTPVTLQVIIDEQTFDKLRNLNITFKNPGRLNTLNSHIPALYQSVMSWIQRRGDVIDKQSPAAVTAIPLNLYQSKWVTKQVKPSGPVWALTGDAAFGLPFFRALNDGLLNGTKLATEIAAVLAPVPPPMPSATSSFWGFSANKCFKSPTYKSTCLERRLPEGPLPQYQLAFEALCKSEIWSANAKSSSITSANKSLALPRMVKASKTRVNI